jgi:hypothetical protein
MRNTVLTVLSLGFATALASPALAKEQLSATPDALSVQAIHNYAGCVANTTPRGAAEALELDFSSPAYGKKISQLSKGHSDSRCMSASRLQYNQVLFAGGMAERLLVDKVQPARFPTMVAYDPASAPIKARSAQEVIGMCMVRAEPAKSWAVFATAPTSHEEASAMQALAPTLPIASRPARRWRSTSPACGLCWHSLPTVSARRGPSLPTPARSKSWKIRRNDPSANFGSGCEGHHSCLN